MGLHTELISGLIVTGTDMPSLFLLELMIKSDLGSRAWIRIRGRLVRDSVTPRISAQPDWRIRTEFRVRDSGLGLFT